MLHTLRFVTPGAMVILFWISSLAMITKSPDLLEFEISKVLYSLPALIFGVVYYVTPLRNAFNAPFFVRVDENLRKKLIEMAGVDDEPNILTWEKIRNVVFYPIIDNDNSLTLRSKQVMFNGFLWTTCADARALSAIFALLTGVLWALKIPSAPTLFAIFTAVFLLSLVLSELITRKHIELGNEQLELIRHQYLEQVKTSLENIIAQSGN